MKRKLCMVMAAMLAVGAMPVYAAEDFLVDVPHTFTAKVGTTEFRKDGEAQPLDVPVYIKDGYTMLPLRTFMTAAMAEWARMEWDGKTGTVAVLHGYHIFTFDVKNNKIMKNGEEIPVYGKMEIRDGRIFVPLRNWGNILQALGYIVTEEDITWNSAEKLAAIYAVEQKLDASQGLEKPVISGKGEEAEFALEMTTEYDELENAGDGHFITQKYPEENVGLGHIIGGRNNVYSLLDVKTGEVKTYAKGDSLEEMGDGWILLEARAGGNEVDVFLRGDAQIHAYFRPDMVKSISEGMILLEYEGKYGFCPLTKKDGEKIECQYKEADLFSEGLASVCLKDEAEWKVVNGVPERVRYIEWGYIDKTGKMAFDEKYRNAEPFYEGLARVRTEDGYGYIDKKGDVVIPCQYKWGGYFRDDMTYVTDYENQTWLIDKTGEKLKLIAEGKSVLYADDRTEDVNEPKNGILYMEHIVDTPDGDHAHVHTYEPTLNTTVMGIVQRYSMFGHFLDIKEACVLGILRALEDYPKECDTPFITYKTRIMWEEIHSYIRTMRTGFTVQSDDEYRNLRNIMRLYTAYNSKGDPDALKKISNEVGLSEKTVKEILQSGFHNMQFVDFYRSYADEDSEESREDVTCDYTFEPCRELIQNEQTEAVFSALDELSYREREVIRSHIGFCPDCHSMKSPKFRPHTFQEIAYKNELSSAEAAENIYHKGLAKMKEKLQKKGIFHP